MGEMVELRAIVRVEMLERVVRALKNAGVPRLTIHRVHALGAGVDPDSARLSLEEGSEYADKAMLRLICAGDGYRTYAELIARAARTGRRGDGIISVHPVLAVMKIRTGVEGLAALR